MTNGSSAEVSKKIRAAIKAKLEELHVYVDEELPDYIMVMIANKKEKAQMKDDLLLFLGKNAGKFVEWLFDMFERLQSAGAAESSQTTSEMKRSEEVSEKKGAERSRRKDLEETEKKRDGRKHSAERVKEKDYAKIKGKEKGRERGKDNEKKETSRQEVKPAKSKSSTHREEKSPQSAQHRKAEEAETREKVQTRLLNETAERRSKKAQHVSKAEAKVSENKKVDQPEKSKSNESRRAEQAGSGSRVTEVHVERKRSNEDQRTERSSKVGADAVDKRMKEAKCYARGDETKMTDKRAKHAPEEKTSHNVNRKRKAVESSAKDLPSFDSDEEARLAELESSKELANKKVSSTAVAKLATSPPAKTVSSQIIVKRKLPEKELVSTQARGVKSLFLKAIKEAGETTRTASQNAGYGSAVKISANRRRRKDDRLVIDEDDEAIEIDVDDDIGDTLVVVGSEEHRKLPTRSVVSAVMDDCKSETEMAKPDEVKRRRVEAPKNSTSEDTKFIITLSGDLSSSKKRSRKFGDVNVESKKQSGSKKKRNEVNPILAHLNISQRTNLPAKEALSASSRKEKVDELVVADNTENESRIVTSREDSWGLQIQLPDEDSSDDDVDEAEIDAVLASAQASNVAVDEIPPTPTLSKASYRQGNTSHDSSYGTSQNIFAINRQVANLVNMASDTIMERCKFWPNCTLSKCVYIHPSKVCSNFPNCNFGNRCLYLHPKCKFDQSCRNPNCVFTHSPKSSFQSTAVTKAATSATTTSTATTAAVSNETTKTTVTTSTATNNSGSTNTSNIPCKYGRNCANSSCNFKHPKRCRFGSNCRNPGCYFWHPKACALAVLGGSSEKYKWKAPRAPIGSN